MTIYNILMKARHTTNEDAHDLIKSICSEYENYQNIDYEKIKIVIQIHEEIEKLDELIDNYNCGNKLKINEANEIEVVE